MTDVRAIARRGLIYGLATIDLYGSLRYFALDPASAEFKAPLNRISHSCRLADPRDRTIVAMNVDTRYSYAWLDLRAEPVALDLPAAAGDDAVQLDDPHAVRPRPALTSSPAGKPVGTPKSSPGSGVGIRAQVRR